MLRHLGPLTVLILAAAPASPGQASEELRRATVDSENVLGTSMHLELGAEASKLKGARKALTGEIERLESILSTWDGRSELCQLPRPCEPRPASAELRAVLLATERWMRDSGGAFHPAVEVLTRLWRASEARGSVPTTEELDSARARLDAPLWRVDDAQGTVEFLSDLPLTFDGLAKGYIIDRAIDAALRAGARDLVLDIGGDVRVVGKSSWTIAVADPRAPADNAEPLCKLELSGLAVATSGGYARGFDIAGQHYSHIFDPRTGLPVKAVLQSTVIAPDATTADALATVLNVLAPKDGLALIAKLPGVASMVVDAQGSQHASPGWAQYVRTTASTPKPVPSGASALPRGGTLVLSFEIQQPAAGGARGGPEEGRGGERGRGGDRRGGGYKRPYVAAWIEDAQGKSIRTLALWIEKPKWLPDLRRWSRLYDRRESEVSAVTRATRAPGKYELSWDGRDDAGNPATRGECTLYLEVVREHGTYQLLSSKFTCDGNEFTRELSGAGIEVKSASLAFRLPKS